MASERSRYRDRKDTVTVCTEATSIYVPASIVPDCQSRMKPGLLEENRDLRKRLFHNYLETPSPTMSNT